jgi:hypothetical protein
MTSSKMRIAAQKIFYLLAIIVAPGTVLLWAASAQSTHDRAWWESTGKDERTQFVAGYLDCATDDHGNTNLAEAQWNRIEPEITRYYASHPQMTRRTVPSLILALGAASRSTIQRQNSTLKSMAYLTAIIGDRSHHPGASDLWKAT